MGKKNGFTLGIATSVLVLLSATVLPSGVAYADSLEKQATTVMSQMDETKESSKEEVGQSESEESQSTAATTTEPRDSDTATTDTSAQEDSTTYESTEDTQSTIDHLTENAEPQKGMTHEESTQLINSDPATEMSSSETDPSRGKIEEETETTESQKETRRKRAPLEESTPTVEPMEELALPAPFDEKAFDTAIDTYIDNATEEELAFVVDAGNESEMKDALEYLLLNQIEEEYGIEQFEELKKYLTAEEIALVENEPSVEKFEALLTKFYDEREQKVENADLFSDFFLSSTDEEIDQILQAKDEQELEQVITALLDKRELENKTASDRNKRFAPLAIPVIKGAIWLAGIGITAYTGHKTYQALEKQRAEKKRMIQRWKTHEQQAKARQQAAQRAKVQAAARARAQAAARAKAQANQRARAQAVAKARAQAATWAKQQAAARARAQAAANARRQSTARPYVTTKPRPKPVIKAKPSAKPAAKPKPGTKPATKLVAKPDPKPSVSTTTHVVKAGESPWSISNKYGITMEQLYQWNNIKNKTIHPNQKLTVKKSQASAQPATKPSTKPNVPASYTVKAGDSVWGIAEKYGLSVAKFVQWNNIKNNTIHPGQTMHLKDPKAAPAKQTPAAGGTKDTTHVVKAGESPWSVSNQYGVTMDQLYQWNNIKNKTIHPNQTLIVKKATAGAKPVTKPTPPTSSSKHKVSYGESLWYIASTYGTSVDALRQLNGIKGDLIHPGQELVVKKGTASTPAAQPLSGKDTISYTVLAGDSVWLIAHKHGVSMDELIKWNNIKNYTIHPGQTVRIQKIVPTQQKPNVTTTPKVEQKPAITTTPKVEQKSGITTTPKVEQKPSVTTTPTIENNNKTILTTELDSKIKDGLTLPKHRVRSDDKKLPVQGEANSSMDLLNPDGSVKQRRYYDKDGKALEDIDYNHSDDGTHTFPHRHKWDWSKNPPRQK